MFACSHHPSVRVSNTISFGYLSVAVYLGACYAVGGCTDLVSTSLFSTSQHRILITLSAQNYYGLPQNASRPGGEVVELSISLNANHSVQFHLISDRQSATEVQRAIQLNCTDVTVKDPIPFNSTYDLRPDTVVQFYRGDSAAIILQGYDNTREIPGSPGLIPNPPFPSSVNMSTWTCLNYTVGESIPLLNAASGLFDLTAPPLVFFLLFLWGILDV